MAPRDGAFSNTAPKTLRRRSGEVPESKAAFATASLSRTCSLGPPAAGAFQKCATEKIRGTAVRQFAY